MEQLVHTTTVQPTIDANEGESNKKFDSQDVQEFEFVSIQRKKISYVFFT